MDKNDDDQKLFQTMAESVAHMKLTPAKKEFAKAVLRSAIEYACMRRAGFGLEAPEKK